jgi:DNA-binding LytR/AlgR family response regulator
MLKEKEPLVLRNDRHPVAERPNNHPTYFSPVDISALERIAESVFSKVLEAKTDRTPHSEERRSSNYRSLPIPTPRGYEFVKPAHIVSLEADGTYTYLRLTDTRRLLLSKNIGKIWEMLCPDCFIQVSRSYVANIQEITGIQLDVRELLMSDGSTIRVPRERLAEVRSALNI